MATPARCSKCGAPVSDEVAGGFCTACLLEEGLAPADLKEAPITLKYFGDYELIEEIARGGMGVVFKARQRSLNRIVAVKMILSGHLASEAEAQRFRAEARAAAALQHPGIVAIHEVGEHEGLLFFSMDYVEGQNLAQVVRDGPLSATRAAECLREIAEAIHYAHEHGVLHRDLKPSNVLLDAGGKPHVTDFGLAKRLVGADVRRLTSSQSADTDAQTADDQSLLTSAATDELTLSGQVLGSPNFMSPEQAAGKHRELTPASDVYSLGALLYHLLTGRPPFLADSIPATLRLVSETEPVAPRLLAPSVPRDLETICLKCLEKDPARRYGTAEILGEELQRFLNHEPIRARPVSIAGRVWRWSRRNPGLARTASAALLLFLAVMIGGPIALLQINRARKQAEARQKEATLEATRSQQFAQFMKAMLRSAGPSSARGRDATVLRELVGKTSSRLETELLNQPEVQGDMYMTLGSTYRDMGDYQHAISMLERAVAKYREAFRGDHKKLALALGYLGQYQSFNTDVAAGKRSAQEGLEMARRCGDAETLADCLMNVARSFEGWGMTATQGLAYAREAADLRRKLTNNPTALADCLSFMAGATQDGGRVEAERLAREALELNSRNLEPDHPNVVGDIFMLGQIELDRGKFAEAEAHLRETLRLHRKIYDPNHPHRFILLRLLGDALLKQGKEAELVEVYREAVTLDGDNPKAVAALNQMTSVWRKLGSVAEAEEFQAAQLVKWINQSSTNEQRTIGAMADLLQLRTRQGRTNECRQISKQLQARVQDTLEHLSVSNVSATISTLGSLCHVLQHSGQLALAESILQQRLQLQRRLYGNEHKDVLDSLGWMAEIRSWGGKLNEAALVLEEKLSIQSKLFGRENTNVLTTIEWLASIYEDHGKWKQAEPLRRESIATRRKVLGDQHADTIKAWRRLCSLLLKLNKVTEAQKLARELVTAAPEDSKVLFTVADIAARAGLWDEAVANYAKVIDAKVDEAKARLRRGEVYGRTGRLKEAAIDLARAVELSPNDLIACRNLAPVLVANGDAERYGRLRQHMLAQFGNTKDSGVADNTAKDCLLLPNSGPDLDAVSKLADLAVTKSPSTEATSWARLCKALAEYRQSHFSDAILSATKAIAAPDRQPERDATAYAVLAMAQERSKEKSSARLALDQANEIVRASLPRMDSGDLGENWYDRIILEILLREAQSLLGSRPPEKTANRN